MQLATTYQNADDTEGCRKVFLKALKKPIYKKSKKVWSSYLAFLLKIKEQDEAKKELNRAMQSLSRHKHVYVIARFAFAEYECGEVDRGRVLFEELISNYPKRSDLWHLYVDKEIKHGYYQNARQLFDRMITLQQSARNAKANFKKYLEFERKYGTEEYEKSVKQKARDYVNSLMS